MTITEPALTTAGSRGDVAGDWPSGFVDLYHNRYADMVRLAHLLTGRNDIAEELVQDCFLRLARRWSDIDRPGAYLRRAVVNASRSHHRAVGRLRPLTSAPEPVTRNPELDETWTQLRRLTPQRRAAVVLRYYEGLDDTEIASLLGCSRSNVRSLVQRALEQLRKALS